MMHQSNLFCVFGYSVYFDLRPLNYYVDKKGLLHGQLNFKIGEIGIV